MQHLPVFVRRHVKLSVAVSGLAVGVGFLVWYLREAAYAADVSVSQGGVKVRSKLLEMRLFSEATVTPEETAELAGILSTADDAANRVLAGGDAEKRQLMDEVTVAT